MTDDDLAVFILYPDEAVRRPVPGSKLITADCGCEAWAAPSTLRALDRATEPVLTVCIRHRPKEAPNSVHVLPDALAEADQHLGREVSADFIRRTGITPRDVT